MNLLLLRYNPYQFPHCVPRCVGEIVVEVIDEGGGNSSRFEKITPVRSISNITTLIIGRTPCSTRATCCLLTSLCLSALNTTKEPLKGQLNTATGYKGIHLQE